VNLHQLGFTGSRQLCCSSNALCPLFYTPFVTQLFYYELDIIGIVLTAKLQIKNAMRTLYWILKDWFVTACYIFFK